MFLPSSSLHLLLVVALQGAVTWHYDHFFPFNLAKTKQRENLNLVLKDCHTNGQKFRFPKIAGKHDSCQTFSSKLYQAGLSFLDLFKLFHMEIKDQTGSLAFQSKRESFFKTKLVTRCYVFVTPDFTAIEVNWYQDSTVWHWKHIGWLKVIGGKCKLKENKRNPRRRLPLPRSIITSCAATRKEESGDTPKYHQDIFRWCTQKYFQRIQQNITRILSEDMDASRYV